MVKMAIWIRGNHAAMQQCSNGFTLIELLIIFAVTGLLSAIGIVAFSTYNQQQIVTQAAAELKNNLRLAQGKAFSQEVPAACISAGRSLVGYEVSFSAERQYSISPRCADVVEASIKSVTLQSTLTLTKVPSGTILFKVITGAVDGSGTITVSGYNTSKAITVTSGGSIY